jgi:hypothetical protein
LTGHKSLRGIWRSKRTLAVILFLFTLTDSERLRMPTIRRADPRNGQEQFMSETAVQEKGSRRGPGAAVAVRFGMGRFSGAQFLGALVLLLVGSPLVEDLEGGELIGAVLLTLVLSTAVVAVGGRHKALLAALVLAVPAVVGKWINHLRPDLLPSEVFLSAGLAFVLFVAVKLFLFILRAPRVNSEVLCIAVATYLLLGVLWGFAYVLVERTDPGAFVFSAGPGAKQSLDGFTGLYFSLVTLCTVGYGDITPASNVARMLAMLEAIAGVFYMAILISRLVSLYSSARLSEASEASRPLDESERPADGG